MLSVRIPPETEGGPVDGHAPVELNAVEADADAGPEWHAGPPGIDLPEAKPGPGVAIPHFEIRRR